MAPTAVKDSYGQTKRTFAEYRTDFVQVEPVKGDELPVMSRMQYVEGYVFTGWNDETVTNNYQIEYGGVKYNIVKIERVGMKMFMKVLGVKVEE